MGVVLVTVGAVLLVSDNDTADSSSSNVAVIALPEQTNYDQASEAPPEVSSFADFPPVPLEEILPPTDDAPVARKAVKYFGAAAMGPDYADLNIVEIGAYGCVSCRKVHQNGVLQGLMEQYPDQIRFIFISWPIMLDTVDKMATEAVLCAMDQSNEYYWAFHDVLFDLTDQQYGRHSTYAHYSNIAESIEGIDVVRFNTCMIDGEHRDFVYDLMNVGFELNLRGTPSFFINGELTSAYSLEAKVTEYLEPDIPHAVTAGTETSP